MTENIDPLDNMGNDLVASSAGCAKLQAVSEKLYTLFLRSRCGCGCACGDREVCQHPAQLRTLASVF
jgi:hypothetical protein